MTRDEVLQRYRHLRLISIGHHSGALKFLSRQALLEHAKRLGLAAQGILVAESEAEMTLVFDLALYTAKERRSRALDRYARATPLPPGSDAARMIVFADDRFADTIMTRLFITAIAGCSAARVDSSRIDILAGLSK